MPLFILCALFCAPLVCQVASTSKSETKEYKEFFDKKNSVLKLYYQYYELSSFDKDDKLLSKENVKHGHYVEFNQTGKEMRSIPALRKVFNEGYLKAWNIYVDGRATMTSEHWPSGKPKWQKQFNDDGSLSESVEWYDGGINDPCPESLRESYKDGLCTTRERNDAKGRCVLRESLSAEGPLSREEHEFHENGFVKLMRLTHYTYDPETKKNVLNYTLEETTSDKGEFKQLTDGIVTLSGKLEIVGKDAGRIIRRVGPWTYSDNTGKRTKVETYKDGKVVETREFK